MKIKKAIILGAGYVGITLAVSLYKLGFEVTVIDQNEEKIHLSHRF